MVDSLVTFLVVQISYPDDVQLEFVRLLHQKARQNVTYHCQNSVAWYNAKAKNHNMAIQFLGHNEFEFKSKKFIPRDVPKDECKVSTVCIAFFQRVGVQDL